MHDVVALCRDILRRQPKNFEALYLDGLAHLHLGDSKNGRRQIKRSCKAYPPMKAFGYMEGLMRHQGITDTVAILERRLVEFKMFSGIDVFALSYPKCGRTWARLVLGTYALNGRDRDPREVFRVSRNVPCLSTLYFSHDDGPHWRPVPTIHTDKSMYKGKKVVLFVRDPRDVLVSYFFQYTLRGDNKIANDADFDGDLSDFIRHSIGGLQSIVRFYNIWAAKREIPDEFLLMRYEDMRADPLAAFKGLVAFLGWQDHGEDSLKAAVAFGDFDNMKKLEQDNTLNNVRLKPPEDNNPEGFKVRRGKVGGYLDYFTDEDIAFVDDYLDRELDDFYIDYK